MTRALTINLDAVEIGEEQTKTYKIAISCEGVGTISYMELKPELVDYVAICRAITAFTREVCGVFDRTVGFGLNTNMDRAGYFADFVHEVYRDDAAIKNGPLAQFTLTWRFGGDEKTKSRWSGTPSVRQAVITMEMAKIDQASLAAIFEVTDRIIWLLRFLFVKQATGATLNTTKT
jgi:hypothetical protein